MGYLRGELIRRKEMIGIDSETARGGDTGLECLCEVSGAACTLELDLVFPFSSVAVAVKLCSCWTIMVSIATNVISAAL
jgi:hypothetical protein